MNTNQEKPHSFFDFRRQVIVRESPSERLQKAAKGEIYSIVKVEAFMKMVSHLFIHKFAINKLTNGSKYCYCRWQYTRC